MKGINFKLVWFDSFGAKSSCTLVRTKDISILIDPGVAIMHPSFPANLSKKIYWKLKGEEEIKKACRLANWIVISHYHWDHFLRKKEIYEKKVLLAKNPNEYINDSQRERALNFFSNLLKGELKLEKQEKKNFEDIAQKLKSLEKDFGNYQKRREELLKKGKNWFLKRVKKWKNFKRIPAKAYKQVELIFPEGKEFKKGKTKVRFTQPLFHGIEYSRVGWVFSIGIERGRKKLIYSSDLNGPIIEDYAEWLIKENPTYLILDGPMTYMLGYTLNLTNFKRVLDNMKRIVEKVDFKVLIWDHHLPRESKFREHTKEIWELAKNLGKRVVTASEYQLGKKPVVEACI